MTGSRSSACSCPRTLPIRSACGWPRSLTVPAAVDAFQAIVLGIVQGLTEFLPISSSGHLLIVPALLGLGGSRARPSPPSPSSGRWPRCCSTSARTCGHIAQSLVPQPVAQARAARDPGRADGLVHRPGHAPVAVFGLLFNDQIEDGARSLYLVGTTLIVLGLVLLLAEKVAKHERQHRGHQGPRRRRHRLRAGAGADPGRLALGRDDHRRPVLRLRPRRRRALLLPAVGPRRRALRAVRDAQDRRSRAARRRSSRR